MSTASGAGAATPNGAIRPASPAPAGDAAGSATGYAAGSAAGHAVVKATCSRCMAHAQGSVWTSVGASTTIVLCDSCMHCFHSAASKFVWIHVRSDEAAAIAGWSPIVQLAQPIQVLPLDAPLSAVRTFLCDQCDTFISGTRWRCTSCIDFDLCTTCYYGSSRHSHHAFFAIAQPLVGGNPVVAVTAAIQHLNNVKQLHAISELEEAAFGDDAWGPDHLTAFCGPHSNRFIDVAEVPTPTGPVVAGYIAYRLARPRSHSDKRLLTWYSGESCYIASIAVSPKHRGQGWGRRLLVHALQRAAARPNVSCALLHVNTSNTVAIRLYSSLGFEIIEVVAGYYGGRADAYRMRLDHDTLRQLFLMRRGPTT